MPCGFGEEDFYVFPLVSLWQLMTPPGGAIFDPRGMVGRIYKEDYLHMTPSGRGLYGPQGHGWQDLLRGPLYIATHKIGKLWALCFRGIFFLCVFSH